MIHLMEDRASRDDKSGKIDFSYLFEGMPIAREEVAKRFIFGANKHGRLNWKSSLGTESHDAWIESCRGSLSRHYEDVKDGKMLDDDGLTNLSGIIWNSACLLEYLLTSSTAQPEQESSKEEENFVDQ